MQTPPNGDYIIHIGGCVMKPEVEVKSEPRSSNGCLRVRMIEHFRQQFWFQLSMPDGSGRTVSFLLWRSACGNELTYHEGVLLIFLCHSNLSRTGSTCGLIPRAQTDH